MAASSPPLPPSVAASICPSSRVDRARSHLPWLLLPLLTCITRSFRRCPPLSHIQHARARLAECLWPRADRRHHAPRGAPRALDGQGEVRADSLLDDRPRRRRRCVAAPYVSRALARTPPPQYSLPRSPHRSSRSPHRLSRRRSFCVLACVALCSRRRPCRRAAASVHVHAPGARVGARLAVRRQLCGGRRTSSRVGFLHGPTLKARPIWQTSFPSLIDRGWPTPGAALGLTLPLSVSPGARSGQTECRLVLRIGTGAPFRTTQPTVFSYCDNPKDKRAFMPVASTAAPDELQVFDIPQPSPQPQP